MIHFEDLKQILSRFRGRDFETAKICMPKRVISTVLPQAFPTLLHIVPWCTKKNPSEIWLQSPWIAGKDQIIFNCASPYVACEYSRLLPFRAGFALSAPSKRQTVWAKTCVCILFLFSQYTRNFVFEILTPARIRVVLVQEFVDRLYSVCHKHGIKKSEIIVGKLSGHL